MYEKSIIVNYSNNCATYNRNLHQKLFTHFSVIINKIEFYGEISMGTIDSMLVSHI